MALCLLLGVSVAFAASLPPGGSFVDDDGNVHEASIEAIAEAGVTRGCNPPVNDRFCPDASVSRGQMAAFLVRALGLTDDGGGNSFVDDDASIFEEDIARLAAAGITLGCNPPDNDRFCPEGYVTRGQMAAFLRRAFAYPGADTDYFTDDDASVFEADINAIAQAGVTLGCNPPTNDLYCPGDLVKRDQMASFLTRALGLTPITPPPPDDTTTTTTTLPGTDHPQSGSGWAFLGCSSSTGTCSYPQAAAEAQVRIEASLLPPDYCIPDPIEPWKCLVEYEQWRFRWFDSEGSQVPGTSIDYEYDGMFLTAVTPAMPISGAATGEYHGVLCRTVAASSDCEETLLTVYFNVTG